MKLFKWLRGHPWLAALAAAAGLWLLGALFTKKPEPQLPVGVSQTAKVVKGDVVAKIEETARMEPLKVVRVKANATGSVSRLAVQEGDYVKQGQLLAVIQPGRPGEAFRPSSVLSPMSGIVIERDVEEGDIVTSGLSEFNGGTQIMAVAKLDAMVAEFQVNEVDINRFGVGMAAVLRLEAFKDLSFTGKVIAVSPKAEPAEGSSLNTFAAKVLVDGKDHGLKPDISAVVKMITGTRTGVPILPVEAIFDDGGEMTAYKAAGKGQDYQKLKVKVGLSDNQNVEILSGLALGDEVSKVRPLKDIPEGK